MNKEIAKRWVAALRSGKYKQGRGALNKNDSFCCLGVLCDISELNTWVASNTNTEGYDGEQGVLPVQVMEWAGIKSSVADSPGGSLTSQNDTGASFSEIASIIEKHWEQL